MNLKKLIKYFKKNESSVSMILGVMVILIVGFFVIQNYNQEDNGEIIPSIGTEDKLIDNNVYVVQKGDDLWKISENLLGSGYEWKRIADENKLAPPFRIEEGQKLSIPDKVDYNITSFSDIRPTETPNTPVITKSPEPTKIAEVVVEQPAVQTIKNDSYEVVKGDTLWSIAVRSYGDGYKWVEIAKANGLKNPSLIHPGNRFVIPR